MRRLEFKLQLAALFHSQPEASQSLNSNGHSSSFDPLNSRGKILVIRGGAIGDFILTLPAIAALRQQFPQAHLEILGYPHIAQLAQIGGLVNRVQSIEARALAGFFARGGELAGDLAGYFSGFNIIVSYLYDPDEIFQNNVARCSRAIFIVGPHRPNEAGKIHATKVFLQPLERLAIFDADHVPRLDVGQASSRSLSPEAVIELVPPFDRLEACPTLALHPGSGSEKKNWPEARWAELIQHLLNANELNLLLVGGEAEGERLQRLAAALPPMRVRVAQSLSLAELARVLHGCMAFVGQDSGISHLAAAVGLPCLVLWGDSVEEIWRPQGGRVLILKNADGLKAMSVEKVAAELTRVLTATSR